MVRYPRAIAHSCVCDMQRCAFNGLWRAFVDKRFYYGPRHAERPPKRGHAGGHAVERVQGERGRQRVRADLVRMVLVVLATAASTTAARRRMRVRMRVVLFRARRLGPMQDATQPVTMGTQRTGATD